MAVPGDYAVPPPGVALHCADRKLGAPAAHYTYTNDEGNPIVHVDYYNAPDDAQSITGDGLIRKFWTYDAERGAWEGRRGVPQPSILYRLNDVLASGPAMIVVVPTERDVEYIRSMLGEVEIGEEPVVPTTWLGPHGMAGKVEIAPLSGKPIMLLAPPGAREAMGEFAAHCFRAGIKVASTPMEMEIGDVPSLNHLWALMRTHGRAVTMAPPKAPAKRSSAAVGVVSVGALPLIERWREWGFDTDGKNKPYMNTANCKKYLAHHPDGYGDVWLDTYRQQIRCGPVDGENREWTDADDAMLQIKLQTEAGLHYISKGSVRDSLIAHAHEHPYHPYRRERETMVWDGVERLNDALRLGWGCPDDEYHRELSRGFFIQQALRVMYPGCKADMMVMFEGPTNIGKTSALSIVFGMDNVGSPIARFGTQRFFEEIQGKVVIEIADLHSFKGAALEAIKAGVTRTVDRFRPAYGRYAEDFPRQSVFVGTTETPDWNEDPEITSRRFPAAECTKVDFDWLRANREHILAEAWAKAKEVPYLTAMAGAYWNLPSDVTREKQRQRVADDAFDEAIFNYLKSRNKAKILDIAAQALGITDVVKLDPVTCGRITRVIRKAGWIKKRTSTERWFEPGPYAIVGSEVPF